jgi:hypothetical protein
MEQASMNVNEQIKVPTTLKLPAQEWLGYDPERGDLHGYTFDQMREVTRAIIKECIDIVETLPPGYKDIRDQIENAFRRDCVAALKERFGL